VTLSAAGSHYTPSPERAPFMDRSGVPSRSAEATRDDPDRSRKRPSVSAAIWNVTHKEWPYPRRIPRLTQQIGLGGGRGSQPAILPSSWATRCCGSQNCRARWSGSLRSVAFTGERKSVGSIGSHTHEHPQRGIRMTLQELFDRGDPPADRLLKVRRKKQHQTGALPWICRRSLGTLGSSRQ